MAQPVAERPCGLTVEEVKENYADLALKPLDPCPFCLEFGAAFRLSHHFRDSTHRLSALAAPIPAALPECKAFRLDPSSSRSTTCAECKHPWNKHTHGTAEAVWFELFQRVTGTSLPPSAMKHLVAQLPGLPLYITIYDADVLKAAAAKAREVIKTATVATPCLAGFLVAEPLLGNRRDILQLGMDASGSACVYKPFKSLAEAEAEAEALRSVHCAAPGGYCPFLCRPVATCDLGAGRVYLVLSYEGPTLGDMLKAPVSPSIVQSILLDVACGLATAHSAGLCFGDLKPANLCFVSHVTLIDGGSITPFGQTVRRTTACYCLDAAPVAGPAFDLVCLAATALHLVTGKVPDLASVEDLRDIARPGVRLPRDALALAGLPVTPLPAAYVTAVKALIGACLEPEATIISVLPFILALADDRPIAQAVCRGVGYLARLVFALPADSTLPDPLWLIVAQFLGLKPCSSQ